MQGDRQLFLSCSKSRNCTLLIYLLFLYPITVPSTLFKRTRKAAPSVVMTSKITNDVTECTKLCLVTEQCKSFYYSQKMMRCEMIGAAAAGNQELKNKSDFYYYERIPSSLMFPWWYSVQNLLKSIQFFCCLIYPSLHIVPIKNVNIVCAVSIVLLLLFAP